MSSKETATQLLINWGKGESGALDELIPIVYNELHNIAHRFLIYERKDHTFTTTALVHEAFLNLIDQRKTNWQNKAHFFAIAAQSMRRILISYARRRNAQKRGSGQPHVKFVEELSAGNTDIDTILVLDESLKRLEKLDDRLSKIVEYRFFAGLTIEETAEVLDISPATVKRDWRTAKAWLYQDLKSSENG
jgi:RNA polymerase sigma factor (TIGR02999 family)